jgi:hypothetical protein
MALMYGCSATFIEEIGLFQSSSYSTERDSFENSNQHSLETSDRYSHLNELNLSVSIALRSTRSINVLVLSVCNRNKSYEKTNAQSLPHDELVIYRWYYAMFPTHNWVFFQGNIV